MKTHLISALVTVLLLSLCSTAAADHKRVVVQGYEGNDSTLSLHLSGTALSLGDDTIDPQGSANLGGVTLSFRWDIFRWGGLELTSAGVARESEGGLINERRQLGSLNWLWYFAQTPDSRWYAVTGLAGLHTDLEIGANTYRYDEGGLVLGVGSEWMLDDSWVISTDLRILSLEADHEKGFAAEEVPPPNDGRIRRRYPVEWSVPPTQRGAIQFNAGIGYRW